MDTEKVANLFKAVWDAFPDDQDSRIAIYTAIDAEMQRG